MKNCQLLTKALHGLPQDLHIFQRVCSRKVLDRPSEPFLQSHKSTPKKSHFIQFDGKLSFNSIGSYFNRRGHWHASASISLHRWIWRWDLRVPWHRCRCCSVSGRVGRWCTRVAGHRLAWVAHPRALRHGSSWLRVQAI